MDITCIDVRELERCGAEFHLLFCLDLLFCLERVELERASRTLLHDCGICVRLCVVIEFPDCLFLFFPVLFLRVEHNIY